MKFSIYLNRRVFVMQIENVYHVQTDITCNTRMYYIIESAPVTCLFKIQEHCQPVSDYIDSPTLYIRRVDFQCYVRQAM